MQADEKRIITDEELTEIVKVAAKAGADAAMEHFKAEKLKEKRATMAIETWSYLMKGGTMSNNAFE